MTEEPSAMSARDRGLRHKRSETAISKAVHRSEEVEFKGAAMIVLPTFVRELVHTSICDKCNLVFREEDVLGFGLQAVKGEALLSVSVQCRSCAGTTSLVVPSKENLRTFIAELAHMVGLRVQDVQQPKDAFSQLESRLSVHQWVVTDGEEWVDPNRKSTRLVSNLAATGLKIRIQSCLPNRKTGIFDVLGGYAVAGRTVVLYRCAALNVVPSDQLALLTEDRCVVLAGFDELSITIPDWPVFGTLPEGSQFRLNGHVCKKLCTSQLKPEVRGLWRIGVIGGRRKHK